MKSEIEPPWVKYPEHPPFDPIYNHELEPYFHLVWRPFFEELSGEQLQDYLLKYPPTEQWNEWINERGKIEDLFE